MYSVQVPKQTTKEARIAARITANGKALLAAAANQLGVSESAIIEMAVREFAEKRNIKPPKPQTVNEAPAAYKPDADEG